MLRSRLGFMGVPLGQHHRHSQCLLHLKDLSPLQDLGREPAKESLAVLLAGKTTSVHVGDRKGDFLDALAVEDPPQQAVHSTSDVAFRARLGVPLELHSPIDFCFLREEFGFSLTEGRTSLAGCVHTSCDRTTKDRDVLSTSLFSLSRRHLRHLH